MPFDGRTYTETKPDVFSLDGLIAWLETQDPGREYCYFDTGGCLLHRYFTARGLPVGGIGGFTWHLIGETPGSRRLPFGFEDISAEHPRTFGGALDRARALRDG